MALFPGTNSSSIHRDSDLEIIGRAVLENGVGEDKTDYFLRLINFDCRRLSVLEASWQLQQPRERESARGIGMLFVIALCLLNWTKSHSPALNRRL
jgi:hypothetical protein